MRFSPRSLFFAMVALGLPFAVTAGWSAGMSEPRPAPVSAPGSSDGIGAAPTRTATTVPTSSVVDYAPRETRPVAVQSPDATPVDPSPSADGPPVIDPSGSASAPPPLSDPPEPSPTLPDEPSPDPTATDPASSAESEIPGFDRARLYRRP